MEYYYQDQLRWGFGFDNPNKAAALLATILPLIWMAYVSSWLPQKGWRQTSLVVLSTSLLVGAWFLLLMTYSRGGLVAAVTAFVYITWCKRQSWRWDNRARLAVVATIIVMAGIIYTGMAARSTQWVGKHEGSVENRLAVWKGGLQMIAAAPQGVGRGNSGETYMQWFQEIGKETKYRTLVNSYLTFAAEQGLAIFGFTLLAGALFWQLSKPYGKGVSENAMIGSRAALIAYAVAGFYTTTMEEPILWIAPIGCVILLAVLSVAKKQQKRFMPQWLGSLALTALCCVAAFGAGTFLNWGELVRVSIGKSVSLNPRTAPDQANPIAVFFDPEVLGDQMGKRLRELAEKTKTPLTIETNPAPVSPRRALVMGQRVGDLASLGSDEIYLLAPARIPVEEARKWMRQPRSVIMLPDFDEDGRVAFWREIAKENGSKAQVITLDGGNKCGVGLGEGD